MTAKRAQRDCEADVVLLDSYQKKDKGRKVRLDMECVCLYIMTHGNF